MDLYGRLQRKESWSDLAEHEHEHEHALDVHSETDIVPVVASRESMTLVGAARLSDVRAVCSQFLSDERVEGRAVMKLHDIVMPQMPEPSSIGYQQADAFHAAELDNRLLVIDRSPFQVMR